MVSTVASSVSRALGDAFEDGEARVEDAEAALCDLEAAPPGMELSLTPPGPVVSDCFALSVDFDETGA